MEGAPASIVAKIRPFIRDEERFKPAVGVDWPAWIRGEMRLAKDPVDQWTKIDVPLGEVPRPATVERVLIVEPAEAGPGMKLVRRHVSDRMLASGGCITRATAPRTP